MARALIGRLLVVMSFRDPQVRQSGAYKEAVTAFREQGSVEGFDKLERMGAVNEVPDEVRPLLVAQDYVWALNAKKRVLVVAPTHREGERVTAAIRDLLKKDAQLGKDEREVYQLRNTHWTDAEKSDPFMYETGQVVQFVKNAPGFKKGERFQVVRGEKGMWFRSAKGEDYVLPLNYTDCFQVYRAGSLTLAAGDLVRTTAGGKPLNARDIDNGCVATVTGFTPKGDIGLSNGMILGKEFGHLASGYYITSWSGQSKTVDQVLVSEVGNMESAYVSFTRGREGVKVYTSDKDALREQIVQSGQRGTATELIEGRVAANTRPKDVTEQAGKDQDRLRKRVAWRRKHEAVAEAIRDRITVGEGRHRGDWHERFTRTAEGFGR